MSDERELLRRTAEIAADFVETLDERPIRPEASVEELRATLGGPLAETPTDPLDVIESLAAASRAGRRRHGQRAVLRVRHRGRASGRPRGRLAHVGLGSERRPRRRWAVGGCGRRGGRRVAQGPARDPGDRVVLLRHRMPDGTRDVSRRGSSRSARAHRLGRGVGRSCRISANRGPDRRKAPHHGRPGAPAARARESMRGASRHRRGGPHAGCRAGRGTSRRERSDHRLCSGGRGEHRRLRPARGDRRALCGRGGMAARRRRVRSLGRCLPRARSPDVGLGASRLLGDGRTQVAQRPLRQRARIRRPSRGPPRRHAAHGGVPRGRGRGRPRPDGLDAGVLAAGTRVRRVRSPSLTRPIGRRGDDRALVRTSPTVRGRRRWRSRAAKC